jgi:LmbE family N-acetylglucosaminyl deacetylase
MLGRILSLVFVFSLGNHLFAQPTPYASSSIRHSMWKFEKVGRVLYFAAHPDDENTRMITWLANHAGVQTAYLSLTRGDGGQNLIGHQLGDELGVIRTQELLEARAIDGGEQFFSRAVDFGFSKSAEESLRLWNQDEILRDVVTLIRKFRPDVIINRFPPNRRAGHGHHEASAILAELAFHEAANPDYDPESVEMYGTWEVKNVFWNTSTWWVTDLDTSRVGKGSLLHVDVGDYKPLLGKSLGELSSESRSMHKSQGFGIARLRGKIPEYLELVKGDSCYQGIFDHVDTSMARVFSDEIAHRMQLIRKEFIDLQPWKSIPSLMEIYPLVEAIKDTLWRNQKLRELDDLVLRCAGFHAEYLADSESYTRGQTAKAKWNIILRSPVAMRYKVADSWNDLPENTIVEWEEYFEVRGEVSHPFYLMKPYGYLFDIPNRTEIALPEKMSQSTGKIELQLYGRSFLVEEILQYKWTDRVRGERIRRVDVVPQVEVRFSDSYVLINGKSRSLDVEVRYISSETSGELALEVPEGFKVSPTQFSFQVSESDPVARFRLKIEKSADEADGSLRATTQISGVRSEARRVVDLDFDHIRPMRLYPEASSGLHAFSWKRKAKTIGYIPGAGDEIPTALHKLGYNVVIIDEASLAAGNLQKMDAIIAGIRAYNTTSWIKTHERQLEQYVENGGRFIIQYNTVAWRSAEQQQTLWPFVIGRQRVTVEEAPVSLIEPNARVWKKPNLIRENHFDNWVQERGLYFAQTWEVPFKPLMRTNDPGEDPLEGAVVAGKFGKGYVIYTGLSFFRQLPAGVPGAYLLFINLLEYAE